MDQPPPGRLRWRGSGPRDAAPPPRSAPVDFDAVIDLDPAIAGHDGAAAVADAVRAMPGARWISVEAHATRARVAVEVKPPGVGAMPDDEAWRALRDRVERVARSALAHAPARPVSAHAPPPRPAASFAFPEPAGSGFAEVTPAALTLLEQLASSPAAPPRSSEGPSDLDALGRLLGLVLPADPRATAVAALARFGSMAGVLAASEGELRAVPGLGTQCVAAIKLVHEAALRLARAGVSAQPLLEDRGRLRAYLAAALAREPVEQFRILFLDDRGRLQADEVQGRGTVNHTPVYPREVIRRATELNAAAIVLVHNHPSGDPAPSRDDLDVTRRIALVADAFGIELRDHLIIGNGRWFSFREQGLLDEEPKS